MDVLKGACDELDAALATLHGLVEAVILAPTVPEKKTAEMAARPALREARNKLFALRAETRRTTDMERRTEYEAVCKDRDERLRNYDAEMKRQIYGPRTQARPLTMQERHEVELMGAGGVTGAGFRDPTQVLQAATNVQRDTLESLQRTEQLQHATEESGTATLQMVRRQTEQMYQVDEELQNLQGHLDRASRDVRWFYRQLAGDKCFLVLFGVLILALLALVFIAVWTKRRK